jgi:hypothetical protein
LSTIIVPRQHKTRYYQTVSAGGGFIQLSEKEKIMTIQRNTTRTFPNLQTMTSGDMGDAMRQRSEALKSKLPSDLAQTIDIFLDMAMQVDALCEGLVTDIGKAALVADLYTLDELLPEGNGL